MPTLFNVDFVRHLGTKTRLSPPAGGGTTLIPDQRARCLPFRSTPPRGLQHRLALQLHF